MENNPSNTDEELSGLLIREVELLEEIKEASLFMTYNNLQSSLMITRNRIREINYSRGVYSLHE